MNKIVLHRKGHPTIERVNAAGRKFTCRVRFRGKVHYFTLAETAEASWPLALQARREVQAGRFAQYKTDTSLRSEYSTLGQLRTAYRAYTPAPPKILARGTKEKNLFALDNFLRKAGCTPADTLPLTTLTGELVYQWKQTILQECAALEDPEAAQRHCRSANSILIQARSIFCDEARTYFERAAKLQLPPGVEKFRAEPGFKNVSKTEYHSPTDMVIAKTFAHLNTLRTQISALAPNLPDPASSIQHPASIETQNEFLACWLALGFGLRASDICRARKSDFHTVADDIAFRPPWFGKNKKLKPEIRVQLDAWLHLGPIVAALPTPESYLLSGHETERTSNVFRRISGWMRALGWQTTHHVHELRAWAGSYIADHAPGDGIRAAQIFLRHSSYTTTEKFYGHHRKQQIAKVKLTLPQVHFGPGDRSQTGDSMNAGTA